MPQLALNGVPIQDSYSETFTARMAAVWITGPTNEIAQQAGYETKGLGRSATQPPCEATIAQFDVDGQHTPDSRPGVMLHLFDRKVKHLRECLALRLRKGTLPYPQTAVFNALPADLASGASDEDTIDLAGTVVQRFADDFDDEHELKFGDSSRTVMRLPRMDGSMFVERRFPTIEATTGGMFLVLGADRHVLDASFAATRAAADGFVTAKCAASGSKVGGKNLTDMVATTNHRYCPSLREQIDDSALPDDVKCVYEVIVSGPTEAGVRAGMARGIAEAVRHESVLAIDTANYGGKLGSGKIPLAELLS